MRGLRYHTSGHHVKNALSTGAIIILEATHTEPTTVMGARALCGVGRTWPYVPC